jgi:hypothetical protein
MPAKPARDPRLTPARPDLAAASLRGEVPSVRFAEGTPCHIRAPLAGLRRAPDAKALETELLHGEGFVLLDLAGGLAWGQAMRDGYVGFISADALSEGEARPTHRVIVLKTFVYPAPSIKTLPISALPMNAELRVSGDEGEFARIEDGFVFRAHLGNLSDVAQDPVAIAEAFLGLPYLWGGTSSFGLDCSGMVVNACRACGIFAPRDSDLQEEALGEPVATPAKGADYRRGDLLFWPGHVALAQGGGLMVHANARDMRVASEAIDAALVRLAGGGIPLRSVRSLRLLSD